MTMSTITIVIVVTIVTVTLIIVVRLTFLHAFYFTRPTMGLGYSIIGSTMW